MLESDYQQQLERNGAQAHCLVELPADWEHVERQRGRKPRVDDERRRFMRSYYPTQSLLEVDQSIDAIERGRQFHVIYVLDLSRNGMGFFHHAQLFPGEQLTLWLPTGKRSCAVARCLRRDARCYEVGVTFEQIAPV